MSIYLFDKMEKLVDIIEKDTLIEWTHTVKVNAYERASFELPVDYNLNGVDYFGFFHTDETFRIFRVTEEKLSDVYYVEGIDKAESDLRTVTVIKDKRPQNATADQALYTALEGTGYEVGTVSGLPEVRSLSFYYISPAEALTKIIETYGCEFRVRYTFVENRITSRYIDLAKRFGKVSGKQFLYGDNALSIEHEETADDVVTALIGRGKGEETVGEDGQATGGYGRRIEFTDIVWSKRNGNPIDKPAGQNYIVSETARQAYGLSQDGQLKHRWGVFVDEKIEDKAVLLQRTYEELQKLSVPITTFKASILAMNGEADYGDSVAIIRDEIGIAFEARLHKVTYDKLDSDRTTVELGDYATLQARQSRAQANKITEAIDGAMASVSAEMEAFNRMIEEKIATKNAEIDDAFRVAQLNMDNAIELAKTNAENYANNIKSQIDAEFDAFEKGYEQETARQNQAIDNVLATANASKNLADEAKRIGEQAKTDAASAMARANQAKTEAIAEATRLDTVERQATETKIAVAKSQAVADATNLVNNSKAYLESGINQAKKMITDAKTILDNQVSSVSTQITNTNNTIKTLATKTDVDNLNKRVTSAETSITQQADKIALKADKNSVDTLSGRVTTAEGDLRVQAGQIALKASQSDVSTLTNRVSSAESSLRVQSDQIALKASKTDVTGLESRLRQAESSLQVQADQISQRVKTSDFDQAKQRLNSAESSITQLGNRITTEISEVEGKIPTGYTGNMLLKSGTGWRNQHSQTFILADDIKAGETYTVSAYWWRSDNSTLNTGIRPSANGSWQWVNLAYDSNLDCWTATFKATRTISAGQLLYFFTVENSGIGSANWATLVSGAKAMTKWQPSLVEVTENVESVKTTINQTALGVEQLSTKLTETVGKVTSAETSIKQLVNDVSSKVSQTTFDNLKRTVDSQGTAITQNQSAIALKAEKTYVDNVKSTADSALTKANSNASQISTTRAELQVTNQAIETKASKTDVNNLTGRLNSAETTIRTQAGLIEQRLTSTQVESAINSKGYQTKSDVDSNITGRGYITNSALQPYALSTTVQNLVKETANSFSRMISETKVLIPTEYSGNLIIEGNIGWKTRNYMSKEYQLTEKLEEGKTYTLVIHWWRSAGVSNNYVPMVYYNGSRLQLSAPSNSTQLQESPTSLKYDAKIDSWVVTFTVKSRNSMSTEQLSDFNKPNPTIRIYRYGSDTANQNNNQSTAETAASFATLVKGTIPLSRWEPAYSELATITALHNVTDTVNSHTRTISDQGKAISQAIQTANGLVTRVESVESNANRLDGRLNFVENAAAATSTQVSQLAGSYAIKNLTSNGQVLNQINLLADGTNRFDGRLTHITGKTLIDNAVIKSAMVDKLKTANFETGSVTANIIASEAVTANHLKADNAFFDKLVANDALLGRLVTRQLFATSVQSVDLSAERVTSGVLRARNQSMYINLDRSEVDFYNNAGIQFHSFKNSIFRENNGITGFLNFQDIPYGTTAALGVTSHHVGVVNIGNENFGKFAGFMARRNSDVDDYAQIYGDEIQLRHGSDGHQYYFKTSKLSQSINMNQIINAVKALAAIFSHLTANGYETTHANMKPIIQRETERYLSSISPFDKIEI